MRDRHGADGAAAGRDLTEHLRDVLSPLRIVFAADESVRTGAVVHL